MRALRALKRLLMRALSNGGLHLANPHVLICAVDFLEQERILFELRHFT